MAYKSHYKWLDANFGDFLQKVDLDPEWYMSLISAHGDKVWQYRSPREEAGIPFEHGAAIYLLSYVAPWDKESRQTESVWVSPCDWVISKYNEFKPLLNPAECV